MNLIYENNNYTVEVGESNLIEDYKVYVVKNKRTGIVEAEDPMLPKAVDYAQQLDGAMEKIVEDGLNLFPTPEIAH